MNWLPNKTFKFTWIIWGSLFVSQIWAGESDDWQDAVAAITPAVVSLKIDHTRAFDENWNQSTHATGFVVDHERGIILTNRHVVGPGPSTAQAVFQNKEEVDLVPLYRDPVHDFGFYQYDPDDLKRFEPVSAQLHPDGAQIGVEIRLIGNDAGEQLSILDGTLARLDRSAPSYGYGKYNDFNTYYLQAASGSSGGSSGSPVIDESGRVVALNAGSRTSAATSYFLPLNRIVRALNYLQSEKPIPRGTWLTTFEAAPFADLKKLGLRSEVETKFRQSFQDNENLLVVRHILPGGPGFDRLQVGDILVSIANELIPDFEALATHLDNQVGQQLTTCVERAGAKKCFELPVDNLHEHTPQAYLEFDGAVIHDLSYQRARHFNRPRDGVYLADPGFGFSQAGLPKGATITYLAGKKIKDIQDVQKVLEDTPQGAELSVRYLTLAANRAEKHATMSLEQRWFPANLCQPVPGEGVWDCTPLKLTSAQPVVQSKPASNQAVTGLDRLDQALVYVRFNPPYPLSGTPADRRTGVGLIVDASKGKVLTSRSIVSSAVGNVYLTFDNKQEIAAEVADVHPVHNLVMLSYNPDLLDGIDTQSAILHPTPTIPGKAYEIIGLDRELKLRQQQGILAEKEPVSFGTSSPPRFQSKNTELLQFINGPTDYSGVVVDEQYRVIALWQKFEQHINNRTRAWQRGIDIRLAEAFISDIDSGKPWRDLGTQWLPSTIANAAKVGLPSEWRDRLSEANTRPYLLGRITHNTEAADKLKTGDILLAMNKAPVKSLIDLDLLSQTDQVELTVLREQKISQVNIKTTPRSYQGLNHIVFWAGALIQPTPLTLAQERQLPTEGAYVSFYRYGSPASRAGLVASLTITEVNDQPIKDISDFVAAVRQQPNGVVRIRAVHLNQNPALVTIRLDPRYWPAYQIEKKPGGWVREDL
ncbi:MAG: trypsin-like peptidase domain-containing protein [Pseudomonadota bacterium]